MLSFADLWTDLADIGLTALSASLTALILAGLPAARSWIKAQSRLAGAVLDATLAKKMDEGARNLIKAAEVRIRASYKANTPLTITEPEEMVQEAAPDLDRNFAGTLRHFGMSEAAKRDYLRARVPSADR